jgi:2-hydroxy-3-keto-5-methylthiopentenyl-1-phosphate phosphatase
LSPKNTTLIIDFEGAITKKNLSYYLFQLQPLTATRDLISSLPFSRSLKKLVRNFKLRYESRLLKNKLEFRRFCKHVYENGLRDGLRDFLYVLNNDGYDYYIVSSSGEEIVKGILGYLPAGLFDKSRIIASNEKKFIWEEEKCRIAK